jgi:DNA-binding SARP family transcriptional activator
MRALYLSGDQVGALRVYRALAARLDEELGVYPAPELQRLHLAILRHDAPAISPPSVTGDDSADLR